MRHDIFHQPVPIDGAIVDIVRIQANHPNFAAITQRRNQLSNDFIRSAAQQVENIGHGFTPNETPSRDPVLACLWQAALAFSLA